MSAMGEGVGGWFRYATPQTIGHAPEPRSPYGTADGRIAQGAGFGKKREEKGKKRKPR